MNCPLQSQFSVYSNEVFFFLKVRPLFVNQATSLLKQCQGKRPNTHFNSQKTLSLANHQLVSQIRIESCPHSDVANVIRACYGETPPPVILIGHGVGGAIAVHTASNMLVPNTVGLVAIDVVEGK